MIAMSSGVPLTYVAAKLGCSCSYFSNVVWTYGVTIMGVLYSLPRSVSGDSDCKLIYRHYATLYFVFCVDQSESELGVLDLIQVRNIIMHI